MKLSVLFTNIIIAIAICLITYFVMLFTFQIYLPASRVVLLVITTLLSLVIVDNPPKWGFVKSVFVNAIWTFAVASLLIIIFYKYWYWLAEYSFLIIFCSGKTGQLDY